VRDFNERTARLGGQKYAFYGHRHVSIGQDSAALTGQASRCVSRCSPDV
jgi:hypothetical protein